MYATPFGLPKFIRLRLQLLREAVQQRRKVVFNYGDAMQRQSERCVSPLGCFFWGDGWALVAVPAQPELLGAAAAGAAGASCCAAGLSRPPAVATPAAI